MSELQMAQEGDINNTNLHIGQVVQISDFPVATITRINNHAVWVAYSDSEYGCVADSDCTPVVASEPAATVERLEDLLTEKQWQILKHKIEYEDATNELWQRDIYIMAYAHDVQSLVSAGYLDERPWYIPNNPDKQFGYEYHVNSFGRRTSADYQRRQGEAKSHLFTRILDILNMAEYYMPGELGENPGKVSADIQEFRDYKALMDKQAVEAKAEVARLEAENAALKADNELLGKIEYVARCVDDCGKIIKDALKLYQDVNPSKNEAVKLTLEELAALRVSLK